MRLLWSLPRATPALLRHIMGYAELAGEDLEQMQRALSARVLAAAIVGVSAFFVILAACMVVVALTWDTPHRVSAIVWMGAAFLAVALIAVAYRSQLIGSQGQFMGGVRREWREDSVIIDHILAPDEE
jgi:uncharacterized membrane protein YqjE